MRVLELFAGAGGGILAGQLLGHETVCAVEWEPDCQEMLRARQADGTFPDFPIYGDIREFDGRPWNKDYWIERVGGFFPMSTPPTEWELLMAGKLKKLTPEQAEECVRMYDSGLSCADVGDYFGISRTAMYQLLSRRTEMRPRERKGSDNHFHRGGPRSSDQAHNIVEKAIKRGALARPDACETCGGPGPRYKDGRSGIQAHHDDYNKPLEVRWLCQPCHHQWHKENVPVEKEVQLELPGVDIIAGGFPLESPVQTSPPPARGRASRKAKRPASGRKWRELSVRYDRATSSWKTVHSSAHAALPWSSVTLPAWGMMRDGACWELTTSGRPISGSGCGFWRTPVAQSPGQRVDRLEVRGDAVLGGNNRHYDKVTGVSVTLGLEQQVALRETWPTPKASASGPDFARAGRAGSGGDDLVTRMARVKGHVWPTPCTTGLDGGQNSRRAAKARGNRPTPVASDHRSGVVSEATANSNSRPLREAVQPKVGLAINPDWAELLMGWPQGFTRLEPNAAPCEPAATEWPIGDDPTAPDWERDVPRTCGADPSWRKGERQARLKAIGNGQVPACAATAFTMLLEGFGEPEDDALPAEQLALGLGV